MQGSARRVMLQARGELALRPGSGSSLAGQGLGKEAAPLSLHMWQRGKIITGT